MPCGPDPGSESLSPELVFWIEGEQYRSEEMPSASPSATAGTLAKLQGLPLYLGPWSLTHIHRQVTDCTE